MNKEIIDYLNSDYTGFYDSDYGTKESPLIYYHFTKNKIEHNDVLIIHNKSLVIHSLPPNRNECFDNFLKSLKIQNGYMMLESTCQIKELERFLTELQQIN